MKSIIKRVKAVERTHAAKSKRCVLCSAPAQYVVKGHPHQTYCKACALDAFKFLNYLEKL